MKEDNFSMVEQRDRFLAFAFAAADILIEVNSQGNVKFAAGSVKATLGLSDAQFLGTNLIAFACADDRILTKEFLNKLVKQHRSGDQLVRLVSGDNREVPMVVNGMKNPHHADLYNLSLKKMPLSARTPKSEQKKSPVAKKDFVESAAKMAEEADAASENLNLSMFDMDWDQVVDTLGDEAAEILNEELAQTARAWAAGGGDVGEIAPGKYSLMTRQASDETNLAERLSEVANTKHDNLDIRVESSSIGIDDVLDFDDFGAFFEKAMDHFDEVGGTAFDLDAVKHQVQEDKDNAHLADMYEGPVKVTRVNAKRKGVQEGWG